MSNQPLDPRHQVFLQHITSLQFYSNIHYILYLQQHYYLFFKVRLYFQTFHGYFLAKIKALNPHSAALS